MTLRLRILLSLLVILVLLLLILYLALRTSMLGNYQTIEYDGVSRNLDRASNTLQDNADDLVRSIHDWSSSDVVYDAIQQGQFAAIDKNLNDNVFWSLHINVMMFIDKTNQIVDAKAIDLDPQ